MTTHAIRDPALRDSHEDVYGPWTASVAAVVREAQAAGEVAAAVDPDRAAWRLTALVEGIGPWLLRCSVGEEWCPLPAGVWGIAVRKRAGPAAAITVRLVVRPAP